MNKTREIRGTVLEILPTFGLINVIDEKGFMYGVTKERVPDLDFDLYHEGDKVLLTIFEFDLRWPWCPIGMRLDT